MDREIKPKTKGERADLPTESTGPTAETKTHLQEVVQATASGEPQSIIDSLPESVRRMPMDSEKAARLKMLFDAQDSKINATPATLDFEVDDAAFEEVTLPSRGVYYNGRLPEGRIRVRMMYQEEEEIFNSVRHIQSGKAVDMVFERVIRGLPFSPEELLSGDRTFLLIWLRSTSYGVHYHTTLHCPFTQKMFEYTFNLTELKERVVPLTPEPFEITLPRRQLKLWVRLPRGKDELVIAKRHEERIRTLGADVTDDALSERMRLLTVRIQDLKTGEISDNPKVFQLKYLRGIPAGDASRFRNKLLELNPGIDMSFTLTSPYNNAEFVTDLPFGRDFFSEKEVLKK